MRCFFCLIIVIGLLFLMGCGEEPPTYRAEIEPIETGISGTTYLNVEHGFRISNLPSSGWVIETRRYKIQEVKLEYVLQMAFTTEEEFTFEEVYIGEEVPRLQAEGIPYAAVQVIGPDPDLPTKPDAAKEIMDDVISVYELLFEVLSEKPVAGVNTTGYEVTMSCPSMYAPGTTWMEKQACFAKHEMGYSIVFCAPEDKFLGLLACIDPMIASFEFLGR